MRHCRSSSAVLVERFRALRAWVSTSRIINCKREHKLTNNSPALGTRYSQALLLPLPAAHQSIPPQPHDVRLVPALPIFKPPGKVPWWAMRMWWGREVERCEWAIKGMEAAGQGEERNRRERDERQQRDPGLGAQIMISAVPCCASHPLAGLQTHRDLVSMVTNDEAFFPQRTIVFTLP